METKMLIEAGKIYVTRRGERVKCITVKGDYPTEARLTEPAERWPVVVRVETGRWRGLTSRLMADGRAQLVHGVAVDHHNDIVAAA